MRFDPNISSLEEREDIGTLRMDELHEIFISYEMRTEQENLVTKEATFKEFNKTKNTNKKKSKPGCNCSDDSDGDEEMANFVRKLKKVTDKYKGVLPFNFFNYGGIGPFASKCPHKNKYRDEE
jgi:hypothetical protein